MVGTSCRDRRIDFARLVIVDADVQRHDSVSRSDAVVTLRVGLSDRCVRRQGLIATPVCLVKPGERQSQRLGIGIVDDCLLQARFRIFGVVHYQQQLGELDSPLSVVRIPGDQVTDARLGFRNAALVDIQAREGKTVGGIVREVVGQLDQFNLDPARRLPASDRSRSSTSAVP